MFLILQSLKCYLLHEASSFSLPLAILTAIYPDLSYRGTPHFLTWIIITYVSVTPFLQQHWDRICIQLIFLTLWDLSISWMKLTYISISWTQWTYPSSCQHQTVSLLLCSKSAAGIFSKICTKPSWILFADRLPGYMQMALSNQRLWPQLPLEFQTHKFLTTNLREIWFAEHC